MAKKTTAMGPFLALIVPVNTSEPPGEGPPVHIWGGGNEPFPTPPIELPPGWAAGLPPLQIWGGGNVPMPRPPIELPPEFISGLPPHIWGGGNEPFPTPPIELPELPPIIIIPPGPEAPIPQPPPPPEIAESSKAILIWEDEAWRWAVVSPPYSPPFDPTPAPKDKRR